MLQTHASISQQLRCPSQAAEDEPDIYSVLDQSLCVIQSTLLRVNDHLQRRFDNKNPGSRKFHGEKIIRLTCRCCLLDISSCSAHFRDNLDGLRKILIFHVVNVGHVSLPVVFSWEGLSTCS